MVPNGPARGPAETTVVPDDVASGKRWPGPALSSAVLRHDLEPDAGAGPLAEEPPALRDLVDQLEPAAVLILPGSLAPVREPAPAVVDHVHVHYRAAAHHRDGHPVGIGGVLDRVRHELTGQQLSVETGGAAVQGVPDEPAGGRHFIRVAAEGPRGGLLGRERRARPLQRVGDGKGRTRHIGLRIQCYYCPYY